MLKDIIKKEIKEYFNGSSYQYFIFIRTYSRWLDNEERRETWVECIDRYISFMKKRLGKKLSDNEYSEIKNAILKQEVMPSMRLLWGAGQAVEKNESSVYNCSFMAINKLVRFREILFLLCSGCGVGFSVEQHVIDNLPSVEKQIGNKLPKFVIPDSREGWADALHAGITAWYCGDNIEFDFSKIRPLGSRLKTFGGRASGPEPLKDLLLFSKKVILNSQGRKLRPIEVHDICTKIAEVVVAGGTRRSSEISLSDLHDEEMRKAKDGNFYVEHGNRTMANNSVAYKTKPTQVEFMREWFNLMESGSGERGIFNREGAIEMMPERRKKLLNGGQEYLGINPCAEIVLRSNQFCNLTSVVARPDDTEETLLDKIRIATIIGTYQSTFSNFNYLTTGWKKNCEEERLLGVSINGQFDCPAIMNDEDSLLDKLKKQAIKTNEEYADKFRINRSTAITCTKPEGTGSQMLGVSSGAHPRYSKYYIRRVRISSSDPLFMLLKDSGVPYNTEVGQTLDTATTLVLEFPIKSPNNTKTRKYVSAIDQLQHWRKIKNNYTEHTVSMTVYVGEDEWLKVGNWVWDNWSVVSGISFLPKEDENHVYKLAPFEEIDEKKYNKMVSNMPELDFSKLSEFEKTDETVGGQEVACGGSKGCDII